MKEGGEGLLASVIRTRRYLLAKDRREKRGKKESMSLRLGIWWRRSKNIAFLSLPDSFESRAKVCRVRNYFRKEGGGGCKWHIDRALHPTIRYTSAKRLAFIIANYFILIGTFLLFLDMIYYRQHFRWKYWSCFIVRLFKFMLLIDKKKKKVNVYEEKF